MKALNVLIGCEESGKVRDAFNALGHNAYSCDLLPCSGNPAKHLQMDIFKAYKLKQWDLVITFQPCTDLTVSGARWFAAKRASGSQEAAIEFFYKVWQISDASENPIGILNGGQYVKRHFPKLHAKMVAGGFPFKPSQIIQPYQFGHGEQKATCLWLKGLPLLKPTRNVAGREQRIWKMAPSPDRAKNRSKTFTGIAKAMAAQWGK